MTIDTIGGIIATVTIACLFLSAVESYDRWQRYRKANRIKKQKDWWGKGL